MAKCECGVDATLDDDKLCPVCAEKLRWDRNNYEKMRLELPR